MASCRRQRVKDLALGHGGVPTLPDEAILLVAESSQASDLAFHLRRMAGRAGRNLVALALWGLGSIAWHAYAGSPPRAEVIGAGGFRIAGGEFVSPAGVLFRPRGINLTPYANDRSSSFAHIQAMYPGLNFVRIPLSLGASLAAVTSFVAAATQARVVVMLENHTLNSINTGQDLAAKCAWYAGLAAQYKGNPYVWFNTQNEPLGKASARDVTGEHAAVYAAIRGAGSDAMLLLSHPGGGYTDWNRGQEATYAGMNNIALSLHWYGYLTGDYGFSAGDTKPTNVVAALANMVAAARRMKSADGVMAVVIDEFGPSTSGAAGTIDGNGWQVLNSPHGFVAWAHNGTATPGGDALTNDGHTLARGVRRRPGAGQAAPSLVAARRLQLAAGGGMARTQDKLAVVTGAALRLTDAASQKARQLRLSS